MNEDIVDLMSEPPHGHNHGRERAESGGWRPLETPGEELSNKHFIEGPREHGTPYTANKIRCGCELCEDWRKNHQKEMYERRKRRNT